MAAARATARYRCHAVHAPKGALFNCLQALDERVAVEAAAGDGAHAALQFEKGSADGAAAPLHCVRGLALSSARKMREVASRVDPIISSRMCFRDVAGHIQVPFHARAKEQRVAAEHLGGCRGLRPLDHALTFQAVPGPGAQAKGLAELGGNSPPAWGYVERTFNERLCMD